LKRGLERELRELEARALNGIVLVRTGLSWATEAVLHRDVAIAAMVIADDDWIDGWYLEGHRGLLALLARGESDAILARTAVGLLRVLSHVERMGDQCVNIAKLVPLDGYTAPVVPALLEKIERMAQLADQQLWLAKRAFADRHLELAHELVRGDDELDRLNRECFRIAVEIGADSDTREWAMHMMLAARYLERIGDNAVDIGEAAAFVVTGNVREFEDASRPQELAVACSGPAAEPTA
jgi:phosphate transport system protein